MSNQTAPAIHVEGLTKRMGSDPILHELDLTVPYGHIVTVVGPNGTGKTLLLRILSGLVYADSGTVRVGSTTLRQTCGGIVPEDVGVIIETPGFLPYLSGCDNLQLLAQLRQRIGRDGVAQAMRDVGLDPSSRKKVCHYSLGMRQRLAIAQAMMEQPRILLLDEPTNGLDPDYVPVFVAAIRTYADQGRAVVVTTHELGHFAAVSNAIYTLHQGQLTPREPLLA